jgi:DNA processing protein
MNNDIQARLALSMVDGVGAKRARGLLEMVEHPMDVFTLPYENIIQVEGIGETTAKSLMNFKDWGKVDSIIEYSVRKGYSFIIPEHSDYSEWLRNIDYPPILLWYKGDVSLLNSAGIAVVGTRAPSLYGKNMTREFTKKLVEQNLVIVSGLARGIDTIAHRAAIESGGKTIAVLGSGLDRVYPSENSFLFDEIIEKKGLVISEYPPGTKPDYQNFPTRNRIVSGLSLGVLVVETDMEGGSMITAELAFNQNREVFVIPHSLDNRKGRGCNFLIRNNTAKMVENVEDIISEFDWIRTEKSDPNPKLTDISSILTEVSDLAGDVFQILYKNEEMHFDTLLSGSGLRHGELNAALLELELGQFIRPLPGKLFTVPNSLR